MSRFLVVKNCFLPRLTTTLRNGSSVVSVRRVFSEGTQPILRTPLRSFPLFNLKKSRGSPSFIPLVARTSTSAAGGENPLVGAKLQGSVSEAVEVNWRNGDVSHYPFLWLRDNCYCSLCKKKGRDVFQRDFLMQNLDPDAAPADIKVRRKLSFHVFMSPAPCEPSGSNGWSVLLQVDDQGEMVLTWNDGHVSTFSHDWLTENGFASEKQREREKHLSLPLLPWNHAEMQDKVPEVTFDAVRVSLFD